MWKPVVAGRTLHFHLAGINNQNFIMADEETGSWFQQVTGAAIQGPLRGARLAAVPWDEVTWGEWRHAHPDTLVLAADSQHAGDYASAHWEVAMARAPTVTPRDPSDRLKPRELVITLSAGRAWRAYPLETLRHESPLEDELGGVPVVLVLDSDGRSVHAFRRDVDGRTLDLFAPAGPRQAGPLFDAQTGSSWDPEGAAIAGPLLGRRLDRLQPMADYWFDFRQYHPDATAYAGG